MHELLEYEASMLLDIHQDSSLLVVADGLGMDTIVYSTLKLHSDPHNLLLVSNYRMPEARFLSLLLAARDTVLHPPSIITADVGNKEREAIYKRGGVVFVSSRILVVDLLMDRMPASLVSGVLIMRAHELQEACQENFAIRLLRERNPSIFIKAMSDNAVSITSGYNHAERIMQQLGIPRLVLWPRFNIQVVACFTEAQPQVEEVRVKLTPNMVICQSCILDLMKACIKELVDLNPMLNTDDLNLENALLPNFDRLIGLYLDPMWHQLSATSRRLIGDIASLRKLIRLLIESDAVAFLNQLEAHRQAALSGLGLSEQARRASRTCPAWFLMDQADRLLSASRDRVYEDYAKKQINIELNPKWLTLTEILGEIHSTIVAGRGATPNPSEEAVLILVGHENTARTVERFLRRGSNGIRRFLMNTHQLSGLPSKPVGAKVRKVSKPTCLEAESTTITLTQLCQPADPSAQLTRTQSLPEDSAGRDPPTSDTEFSSSASDSEESADGGAKELPLPLGCRRVQVSSSLLSKTGQKSRLRVIIRAPPNAVQEDSVSQSPPSTNDQQSEDYLALNGHRLGYVLDRLQPRYVVLYEPRVSWVRELEVHKARRHTQPVRSNNAAATADADPEPFVSATDSSEPDSVSVQPLEVFFMLYENSVEEQRYLTNLRREKEAFESLIQLSSRIVIPKDSLLPGISGSTGANEPQQPRVIVDMREFRSELPALLHRKGLKVEPLTLSVADYILAPHLCVERKSVADLIGSLNSGRLYQQCTAMSRHYPNPVLLIEFSMPTKITGSSLVRGGIGFRGDGAIGFSLYTGRHSISSGGEFNSRHLLSKLTLLTIHFPNLRLFWSVTPYCTAELFAELKQGRAEPSIDRLPQDGEHLEDHNVEAVDMLLKMPGISWKNYRRVMNSLTSLHDLAQCSLDRLIEILDSRECATKLFNFLHCSCELSSTKESEGTSEVQLEAGRISGSKRSATSGTATRGPRLFLAGRVKTKRGRGRGGASK